jgi:hypothetical protein
VDPILFHVSAPFADATVTPQALTPVELAQLTMDPDQVHIEAC